MSESLAVAGVARRRSAADPLNRWDRLGVAASLACAVHCMAAPFLLLLLPAVGMTWSHPAAHWVLAGLVLPLAGWVVWRGFRLHRRWWALVAAGLGGGFIIAGLVLPELSTPEAAASQFVTAHHHADHAWLVGDAGGLEAGKIEPLASPCTDACCPTITQDPVTGSFNLQIPAGGIATLIGSLLLVLAHGINLHGCRCARRLADDDMDGCGCAA